jgi:hypothetical protein
MPKTPRVQHGLLPVEEKGYTCQRTKTPRVQHGLLPVEEKGYTCQRRLASNMAYCLLRRKAIHAEDASRPTWLIAC